MGGFDIQGWATVSVCPSIVNRLSIFAMQTLVPGSIDIDNLESSLPIAALTSISYAS